MTQKPHTIVKTLVLFATLFFLSSCADRNYYGTLPQNGSQGIAVTSNFE